jgi:microcystin-dependent protein
MANPFIGMVQAFGFHFAPRDWALCWGQFLLIMDYQALYALIGSYFGGDWRTNMAVPDLRGRVNMGQGTPVGGAGVYDYAEFGGDESYSIPISFMTPHTHNASFDGSGSAVSVEASQTQGSKPVAEASDFFGSAPAFGAQQMNFIPAASAGTTIELGGVTGGGGGGGVTLESAGVGHHLDNMMPSLVVNWCIALEGIFPARN